MDNKTYGLNNETTISKYLDHKRVMDLNEKWHDHIMKMFPNAKEDDSIMCYKFHDNIAKPDLTIRVGTKSKNISIKTGRSPAMHKENIFSFTRFLETIGISNKTSKTIYFYLVGKTRKLSNNGVAYTREEIMEEFGSYIAQANEELNSNEEIIAKAAERIVLTGSKETDEHVDFLYYGVLDKGILLSKEDIINIITKDKSDYNKGMHIGGLTICSSSRVEGSYDSKFLRIHWPLITVLFYDNNPDKYISENYKNGLKNALNA